MDNERIAMLWNDDENRYRLRTVLDGRVDGVLRAASIIIGGRKAVCYDTEGYVSLERWCRAREIKGEELSWIIGSVLNTLIRAEKYLLSPSAFPLDPGSVFINDLRGEVCLVIRKEDGDWQTELIKTARLILEAIDYKDDACVKAAYEFYHFCLKDGLRVDELAAKMAEKEYKIIVDEKPGQIDEPYDSFEEDDEEWNDSSWIDIKREQVKAEEPKTDRRKLVKKLVIGVCLAMVCVFFMKTTLF